VEKCALTEELRNFRYELFNASLRGEQERGTEGVLHYEFPEETILPNGTVPKISVLTYVF
jgi:hypothetical protein